MAGVLRRAQAELVAASSVGEAVAGFIRISPDVVFDLAMHDKDGYGFLRAAAGR